MRRRRKNESGFALLLIFLMGAVLAITLYREIPRVAFETQRQKELLLIERGEQYKRALYLFFKEYKRYPSRLEDLENTNNKHYLRRRYVDPMTGKDEWRVIKIVNGVLVDSKVQKQGQGQEQQKTGPTSTYVGEIAGLGQTLQNQGQSAANPGLRRRGSDNVGPGGPGAPGAISDPNAPPQQAGVPQGVPGLPGQPPAAGIAGMPPGMPGATGQQGNPQDGSRIMTPQPVPGGIQAGIQPGMIQGQPINMAGRQGIPGMPQGLPGATGSTGTTQQGSSYLGSGSSYLGGGPTTPQPVNPIPGQQPGMPTGMPGGMPGAGFPPGQPVNSQNFGGTPAYPTAAGSNGPAPAFGQPGMATSPQAQNAAAQMIGQILTQPRPGGMPQANTTGMAVGGSGIAGFASTADQESIIVYNDQTNYGLWEFVFDPAKVKPIANPAQATVGTPASQIGSPMGQQIGQPMNSPFGQQPQPTSPFGAPPGGSQFGQPMNTPLGGRRQ